MSIQEKNVLKCNSVFSNNPRFSEKDFNEIEFDKVLYSINEKPLKFSNFIKDTGDLKFKELKKIYFSDDPFDILNNEFETKNVYKAGKDYLEKIERLFKIINRSSGIFLNIHHSNISDIIRYKHLEYPEYQLYFYKKNNKLNLILVDMHHLGITAKDRKTMKNDYKDKYNEVYSRYKTDISLIKQNII